MNIDKLPEEFIGTSTTKGWSFTRVYESDTLYCYSVNTGSGIHYEVFMRKITPKCIDFANRIYSESEFKEIYPKDEDFGKWGWTINHISELRKFDHLQPQLIPM